MVTDLDGTLWDGRMQCHPTALAAFAELQHDATVELLVATGRRRNSARSGLQANGIVVPSVLLNGATGFDFVADKLFHQVTFDDASLIGVITRLQASNLAPVVYLSGGHAFVVEGVSTSTAHIDSLGSEAIWGRFDDLLGRNDVLGMSILGIDYALIESAVTALKAFTEVEVAAYADHLFPPHSLMIAPAGVNKAVGIEAYLRHRGFTPERIVALGDAGNDLEMLEMADVSLVVAGGDDRALALADHVIERPQDGGWVAVLDHI